MKKKLFTILLLIFSIFSYTKLPTLNINGEEIENTLEVDFQNILRNYDYEYSDVLIPNNNLMSINNTYMIEGETFSSLTGDRLKLNGSTYQISNDDYTVEIDPESNSFIVDNSYISSEEDFVEDNNCLYVPLENLAKFLGYQISFEDSNAILSRPFASKRLIVDSDNDINLLNSVAYARDDNFHVIQFESEQHAHDAFDYYSSIESVDNVAVDIKVHIAENESVVAEEENTSSYVTWGGKYLGIDEYLDNIDNSKLKDVVVAVIDTGIDPDHTWFENRIVSGGVNFTSENLGTKYSYQDGHKHGTHVSGTIVDLTPSHVKILPIKALDSKGFGDISSICAGIEKCIDYKKNDGMNIVAINMSLGGQAPINTEPYTQYASWIDDALENNIFSVVAAGNDSMDCIQFAPANVASAITVSAVKEKNNTVVFDDSYSNYGSFVDISAPGTAIQSAVPNDTDDTPHSNTQALKGTSMATPHVSAVVALLMSNTGENFTTEKLQTTLFSHAIDLGASGKDPYYGYGFVNISHAYTSVLPAVTFSHNDIYYTNSFDLTLTSSTANSKIYYTLDGTQPDNTSLLYSAPIPIQFSETNVSYKVSAIAYLYDSNNNIIGISPVTSRTYSSEYGTSEDFFEITSDGIITAFNEDLVFVTIPDTINGITPVSIYREVFYNKSLFQITMPNSIKTLDIGAFAYCLNLQTVTANGIEEVNDSAFEGCSSLKTLTMNNLKRISSYSFLGCDSLETLSLPAVEEIKFSAFTNNPSLKTLNLPNLTSLGSNVFYNCTTIQNINVPKLEVVGSSSFYNCKNLPNFDMSHIKYIGNFAFYNCLKLNELNLSNTQTIGLKAFYNCSSITQVTLSRNLEIIGNMAFDREGEYILDESTVEISFICYNGNAYTIEYIEKYYPQSIIITNDNDGEFTYTITTNDEITITGYSQKNKEIYIPEYINGYPVTRVSSNAFEDCENLYSINSKTLKYIENEAFLNCSNLSYINLPNIISIGKKAFYNCSKLNEVNIDNVYEIDNKAFVNCSSLNTLSLGSNVTQLGDYSIGYNYSTSYSKNEQFRLKAKENIIVTNYATTYEIILYDYYANAYEMYYTTVLNTSTGFTTARIVMIDGDLVGKLSLPATINNIPVDGVSASAFEKCTFITHVYLPSSIYIIGNYAFYNCISLKEINLDNVTKIGESAFENCISLEKISLYDCQTLPTNAFKGCQSLTSAYLPVVNVIGSSAFENCYNLKTITYNQFHLDTIKDRAFYNNYSLTTYNFNGLKTLGTQIGTSNIYKGEVFAGCTSLTKIYLNNIVNLGNDSFENSRIEKVFIGKKLECPSEFVTSSDHITIYSHLNTTAHTYAQNYNINFIALDSLEIIENLPTTEVYIKQNATLSLNILVKGYELTYKFYKKTSPSGDSYLVGETNSNVIDTSQLGTYYYYYYITSWDGQAISSNLAKVVVLDSAKTYQIEISHGEHGTVSPSGNFMLEIGNGKVITITPDKGYRVKSLIINDKDYTSYLLSNNTYTVKSLTANDYLIVMVEFELDNFYVNISSNELGITTPDLFIPRGESPTVTFTANEHCHIKKLLINDQEIKEAKLTESYSYTIENISNDFDIVVEYEYDTVQINITKQGYGEISSSGIITLNYNSNMKIEFFPDDGYKIEYILLDGQKTSVKDSYELINITENHTIHAVFEERKYIIVLNNNSNQGDIVINGEDNLTYGSSRTITITPKEGFIVDKVTVNGEEALVRNNEVEIKNITDDLKIDVTYAEDLNITIERTRTTNQLSTTAILIIAGIAGSTFLVLFLCLIIKKKRI